MEVWMAKSHVLGTARIGSKRDLKVALEKYWQDQITANELQQVAHDIRANNFKLTQQLDYIQVGDFSLYDQVLDTSLLVGNLPSRAQHKNDTELDNYFRVARGKASNKNSCCSLAGDMTKWFDTNYHYIVPEFDQDTEFKLNPSVLLKQVNQAKGTGADVKVVILGPVTYLHLGKEQTGQDKLRLLDKLLPVYLKLLDELSRRGIQWVQIDEPALVTELSSEWQLAYRYSYNVLKASPVKLLLTSYFGNLGNNLSVVSELPVAGIHIDVTAGFSEAKSLLASQPKEQVLSLGVIDGRNIWRSDVELLLAELAEFADIKKDNLWLAPSCSLLHVPVDLDNEQHLSTEIKSWLAFGKQKIAELLLLVKAVNQGKASVASEFAEITNTLVRKQSSPLLNHTKTQAAITALDEQTRERDVAYQQRKKLQTKALNLPKFPTTTIGSFPQTKEVRNVRQAYKQGSLGETEYVNLIKQEIEKTIRYQEEIGLDILVHGEAERNDMVEYFGELLSGITQSQFGWVQSYGSRCVKPPIIYGDVHRAQPLTLQWANYAQSLTDKPVKGMLTGPVTILNWSFVRNDQPLNVTCQQIALAIKEEIADLEQNGISIIQVDEASLREGLPLKQSQWQGYLDWAIDCFKLSVSTVQAQTQIHTHMCYSEFEDIIDSIAAMDADVITIESARSGYELLRTFESFAYQNQIGAGVYDIHSPNTPTVTSIREQIEIASKVFDSEQIWVNPDCGLKTRTWAEVKPALCNMVEAAKSLR